MSIENFDEVKNYFETNKDNDDVKTFVAGLNPINLDRVKEFVGKDKDAQSWLDSEKDKHLQKGLETFKTNNLQKLIDEAVAKANPQETPEQKKIRELEAKFEQSQKDSLRKDLTNKALKVAQEKKLPTNLINYFVGNDEDTTKTNLKVLEKEFNSSVQAQVEERLKGGYKPPKDNTNLTAQQQAQEQINKYFGIKSK